MTDKPIILHMLPPGECEPMPAYDWQPIPERVDPDPDRWAAVAARNHRGKSNVAKVIAAQVRYHTAGGPCPGEGMAPDCGRVCPMCGAGWTTDLETVPAHLGEQ